MQLWFVTAVSCSVNLRGLWSTAIHHGHRCVPYNLYSSNPSIETAHSVNLVHCKPQVNVGLFRGMHAAVVCNERGLRDGRIPSDKVLKFLHLLSIETTHSIHLIHCKPQVNVGLFRGMHAAVVCNGGVYVIGGFIRME